jgi:hypothetical protein
MLAIDNFSECNWYMKRHRFRRLEWFFRDSEQIEKWLNEINDYREEEVDT